MSPDQAEIFQDIAREVALITGRDVDGTFVYAEAGRAWQEVSIFVDEGNRVRYHRLSLSLCDMVDDLWDQSEESKRWSVMLLDFKANNFVADFMYPDQLDPDEGSLERRDRALAERFGDKEVVYPPTDGEFVELTLDDFKHLEQE